MTTTSGAGRLGDGARGLEPWATTRLEAPGRPAIEITATPCRHGPPLSHPIVGDVIGFALAWEDQDEGVLWISGDTVLYDGVRQVADRLDVATAVLHLGGVRFGVSGPLRYTLTAAEAVELCGLIRPRRSSRSTTRAGSTSARDAPRPSASSRGRPRRSAQRALAAARRAGRPRRVAAPDTSPGRFFSVTFLGDGRPAPRSRRRDRRPVGGRASRAGHRRARARRAPDAHGRARRGGPGGAPARARARAWLARRASRAAAQRAAPRAQPQAAARDGDAVLGRDDQAARPARARGPGQALARPGRPARHARAADAARQARDRPGDRGAHRQRAAPARAARRGGAARPGHLLRKLLGGVERARAGDIEEAA